jgi:hypothetical protein
MQLKTGFAALGVLVCLGAITFSTAVAATFGWSIGVQFGPTIGYACAAGGAMLDLLKSGGPIFIGWRWAERNYTAVVAGVIGFVIVTTYSLTSSFGLIAALQADKIGGHAAVVTTYKDRRADLDRLLAARAEIKAKPISEDARVVAQAAVDRADASVEAECADARGPKCRGAEQIARTKRDELAIVVADLAAARQAADLDGKIAAAQAALDKVDAKEASREADPQGAALTRSIRRFAPIDQDTVSDAVHTLFALAIEFASGFGLLLVLGHHGSAPARGEPADNEQGEHDPRDADETAGPIDVVERFRSQRVRPVPGGRVAVADMHSAYLQVCQARGIEPLSLVRFGKLGASIWRREKIAGKVWYMDVALIPVALSA